MPPEYLLDAGPLIAFFNPRDEHHSWAVDAINQVETLLISCEPVLTEAFHLLAPASDVHDRLAEFCAPENVQIEFRMLAEMTAIRDLMRKYRDVPMDLADACLVLLAEQHPQATVVTTDRDFLIYRTRNRRQIRLLAPFNP